MERNPLSKAKIDLICHYHKIKLRIKDKFTSLIRVYEIIKSSNTEKFKESEPLINLPFEENDDNLEEQYISIFNTVIADLLYILSFLKLVCIIFFTCMRQQYMMDICQSLLIMFFNFKCSQNVNSFIEIKTKLYFPNRRILFYRNILGIIILMIDNLCLVEVLYLGLIFCIQFYNVKILSKFDKHIKCVVCMILIYSVISSNSTILLSNLGYILIRLSQFVGAKENYLLLGKLNKQYAENRKLLHIIDSLNCGIIYYDENGNQSCSNSYFERLTKGYDEWQSQFTIINKITKFPLNGSNITHENSKLQEVIIQEQVMAEIMRKPMNILNLGKYSLAGRKNKIYKIYKTIQIKGAKRLKTSPVHNSLVKCLKDKESFDTNQLVRNNLRIYSHNISNKLLPFSQIEQETDENQNDELIKNSNSYYNSSGEINKDAIFVIEDVTDIVLHQHKVLDKKYKNIINSKLSHEVKTPSIGIISQLSYVVEQLKDLLNWNEFKKLEFEFDKIGIMAEQILNIMILMTDYVNGLQNSEMNFEKVELNKIAEFGYAIILSSIYNSSLYNKIKVNHTCSDDLLDVSVSVDVLKLKIILTEAIKNSLKNTFKGEISLLIYEPNDKSKICLELKDTGCGILPDKLNDINQMWELLELEHNQENFDDTDELLASVGTALTTFYIDAGLNIGLEIIKILCLKSNINIKISSSTQGTTMTFEIKKSQKIVKRIAKCTTMANNKIILKGANDDDHILLKPEYKDKKIQSKKSKIQKSHQQNRHSLESKTLENYIKEDIIIEVGNVNGKSRSSRSGISKLNLSSFDSKTNSNELENSSNNNKKVNKCKTKKFDLAIFTRSDKITSSLKRTVDLRNREMSEIQINECVLNYSIKCLKNFTISSQDNTLTHQYSNDFCSVSSLTLRNLDGFDSSGSSESRKRLRPSPKFKKEYLDDTEIDEDDSYLKELNNNIKSMLNRFSWGNDNFGQSKQSKEKEKTKLHRNKSKKDTSFYLRSKSFKVYKIGKEQENRLKMNIRNNFVINELPNEENQVKCNKSILKKRSTSKKYLWSI